MRELKNVSKKILSLVLTLCMIIGLVPITAAAETTSDALTAALEEAKTYIDTLTINNSSNDPETVVSNFGTHFTWDNEKRESSKSYLFDWSYYNGVVFEGLEYVYDETEDETYGDYVEEYMSSLISSDGTWATCSNNSSKECAGYSSTHGADCYKTASLLLDMYERTGDDRYLTIAKTLYADLDSAANSYLLSDAGNNYRHTWATDPSPDLWLDGLYMILPFRAEYAKYSGDTEELDLIVERMQWVSDNMYDEETGLFYHAADSASSNSGTFWLRSIGWYAAAIVDVMDSMEGENLEAMKTQLVKLVDGMKAVQSSSNGMWLNNLAASQSSSNPYETSGTALVGYSVMKAVNEGWLDASYADMAILAFEGICEEKLDGTTLTDICFKGTPGSSNSTFYDDEGKGVGPFIMFYAEVMEYQNDLAEKEEDTPTESEKTEVTVEDTTIKVENVTGLTGAVVTEEDKSIIEAKAYTSFVAFDIAATIAEGAKAIVSIPVPTEWNATEDELVGISVEDGVVKEIKGTLSEDGVYSFEVDHFSAKGVAYSATPTAKVASAVLIGNTPVTTEKGVEPDFSNIKLEVTYEDGDTAIITVDNGLVIEGYDITTFGTTYAKISYLGVEYGEVLVKVGGNPYTDLEEATDYPEYPADGAVRIEKTATHSAEEFNNTGVTHVELDVAGISVKRGVDVVLVADISNSMAWKAGAKNTSPGTGETTKWQDLQAAAGTFADTLLEDNEAATEKNTLSFVMFGGFDAERNSGTYSGYFDATQTVYTSVTDIDEAKEGINAYSITGNDTDGYTVTKNGNNAGTPQGGTNYDYAFLEAASAIEQVKSNYATANSGKSYDESGREIYVVFMTDGAPDHYNQLYYKSRKPSQFGYNALYRNTSDILTGNYFTEQGALPSYNRFIQHVTNGYYMPSSGTVTNANWITWLQTDSLYAAEQVAKIENVNSITAIGFDLANGAFSDFTFGETVLEPVLANLAGENSCDVFLTDDAAALNDFYKNLASKIKYAGTSAQVTDIIDSDFTLQMANYSGSGDKTATLSNPPSIAVTAYDLYAKSDNATDEEENDLTGSRTGTYDVMEVVTFNADGTEAYSDQIGEGKTNIMSTATDGTVTIEAFYFTYTKTSDGVETFEWTIGNITDKEIVLAFDVYLKGALEGEAEKGTYYTNEEAKLEYIDINGKYATQIFDVPHVNWGGASTTIRFYLVNAKGQPVNHVGDVIPWANRIYVGDPVQVNLNLNADLTIPAQTIEAAAYVPGEYFLYDANAEYTVQTASGESVKAGITISEPSEDAKKTTHDSNGNAVTQKGAQTTRIIDAEGVYYTWSVVGFGVRYDLSKEEIEPLNPDTIVMDYGKDIQVDVLANDTEVIPDGWTAELVGYVKYNSNTDIKYIQANAGSATYAGDSEYGAFSIDESKVNYKPTKMLSTVQKVFCVIKFTETADVNNVHYRYNVLNIVPATSVYYETSDASGNKLFGITTTETEWSNATVTGDIVADGPQDNGTIGQNLYGFDSTYENDKYLSNGSSLKAIGQGVKVTTSNFSFTGTGFDLISRTGAEQGSIRVDIYSDEARTNRVKSITVLNKSESALELYQIPVVSAEMDTYGTYYVTVGVNAAYTNDDYPALSRGGEFFFDAIRVYNPVSSKDADYNMVMSAYMADGEANMELKEVRNILIDDEASLDGTEEGIVFVDRYVETDEDGNIVGEGVGLADYTTIGPNNEVYLVGDQAIGFAIEVDSTNLPTSIDIGAKSVHGEEAMLEAAVYVGDADDESVCFTKEIASGTAQNFDLLDGNAIADVLDGETTLYVIIDNLGEGILSITDLKIAYGNGTSTARIYSDETVLEKTVENVAGTTVEDAVNYDVLSAEFTKASIKRRSTVTLTVTTSEAVETLGITNKAGRNQNFTVTNVETADGVKTWTVQYKITSTGTQTYTVAGYGADGSTGATVTASIKVTR